MKFDIYIFLILPTFSYLSISLYIGAMQRGPPPPPPPPLDKRYGCILPIALPPERKMIGSC